ncbi:hypothetical protein BH11PSE11_BH11PSE11_23240 [soil metagenome]
MDTRKLRSIELIAFLSVNYLSRVRVAKNKGIAIDDRTRY